MIVVIETTTGDEYFVERHEHHPDAAICGTLDDLKRGESIHSCDDGGPYFEVWLSREHVTSVRIADY